MEALQWIISAGTNIGEAIQLNSELDRLRASLPKAHMLIGRSEWGMFKNKKLAELLSHLKDTTYDAEDLLRGLDDQVLRQRIEDADRSWAGQLLSSSLSVAKTLICRSKTKIKETQDRLDKVVVEIEGVLSLMGLMSVEPYQIMPETTSLISAPEVVGRDGERDALIEKLGVMLIGRQAQQDQVMEQMGVALARGGSRRSAASKGKRAVAASNGVASTSRAKQQKGNNGRAGVAETNCTDNVSVISIVGIGGVGKTTLAQYIYNDRKHSNILFLSLKGCKLVKLPESICELSSLRYLDISHSSVQELPRKLWCLYSLQVLDASRSSLKKIYQDVTNLMNLHHLLLPAEASQALSKVRGLGNLSCLRNLSDFRVAKENGRGIGELKFMNQLNGRLSIRSIVHVGNEEEAAEARLVEKQYLKELVLHWRKRFTSLMPNENGVLEGLRPYSRIECLKVHSFCGDRFPSWFKPEDLPTLVSLELSYCKHIKSLSIPCFADGDGMQVGLRCDDGTQHASSSFSKSNGILSFAFTRLTALHIYECTKLTNLEHFLTPEKMPSIKSIIIKRCLNLASIPVHSFGGFVFLQDLKIYYCDRLKCPRAMVLPPSVQRLCIENCHELDRSFPACLEYLTSLTLLKLGMCPNVKCIPLNSIGSNLLKCLVINNCRELSSIGGLHSLASVQHVELSYCPMLTEVQLPFEKKELRTKEGRELLKFL